MTVFRILLIIVWRTQTSSFRQVGLQNGKQIDTPRVTLANSVLLGTRIIRDTSLLVREATTHSSLPEADTLVHPESASGRAQWEPPAEQSTPSVDQPPAASTPPIAAHNKRRQYASNQGQIYYGANQSQPAEQSGYLGAGPQASNLFTPGLAIMENQQFSQQQQAHPPPTPQYFGGQSDYGQAPAYGQPQQPAAQPQMGGLADQFGNMGLGGGGGAQKGYHLQTANLITSPPDPLELLQPPPEIRLPPNSAISNSPFVTADPSYQRCTINAIPTTSSLLGKAKAPLALVITPYRTVGEGEPPVPLVTDTVIARCRRCRTYINPYVQFIDGGNR